MSTVVEQKILEEFYDYRAYVSHTLCKNRFFLYLRSEKSEVPFTALSEPSVWSILKYETQKLFELGPTLFGIDCPAVFIDDREKVNACLKLIDKLKDSNSDSVDDLISAAENLRDILSNIPDRFLNEQFHFRLELTVAYLKNKTAEGLKAEILNLFKTRLLPLIENDDNTVLSLENYKQYWDLYPEIVLKLRECIVAAAVEGKNPEFITAMKNKMYAIIRSDVKELLKCRD